MTIHHTTLDDIRKQGPCPRGWTMLLAGLNKTQADSERLDFGTILQHTTTEDAVWCLKCLSFQERRVFHSRVAELGVCNYESVCPDDQRIADYIAVLKDVSIVGAEVEAAYLVACQASMSVTVRKDRELYWSARLAADSAINSDPYATATSVIASLLHAHALVLASFHVPESIELAGWRQIEQIFIDEFCT